LPFKRKEVSVFYDLVAKKNSTALRNAIIPEEVLNFSMKAEVRKPAETETILAALQRSSCPLYRRNKFRSELPNQLQRPSHGFENSFATSLRCKSRQISMVNSLRSLIPCAGIAEEAQKPQNLLARSAGATNIAFQRMRHSDTKFR